MKRQEDTFLEHHTVSGCGIIIERSSIKAHWVITRSKYHAEYIDWCRRNRTLPCDKSAEEFPNDEAERLNFMIRSERDNSKGWIKTEEVLAYLIVENFGDDLQMEISDDHVILYRENCDNEKLSLLETEARYYGCLGIIRFNGTVEYNK